MGGGVSMENSTWKSGPWINGQTYNCSFELYPMRQGPNHVVFSGTAKRRQTPLDENFWADGYLQCFSVCKRILRDFNNYLRDNGRTETVSIVIPTQAAMRSTSKVMAATRRVKRFDKVLKKGEYVVFEEKLRGKFEQYTVKNGEIGLGGNDVVEAFGHFAFHNSDAGMVLCNLRGVLEEGVYRLLTPDVHSMAQNCGENDKGQAGISEFFQNHQCNSLCDKLRSFEEETEVLKA